MNVAFIYEHVPFRLPFRQCSIGKKLFLELMASKNMGRIGPFIVTFSLTIASPSYPALDIGVGVGAEEQLSMP